MVARSSFLSSLLLRNSGKAAKRDSNSVLSSFQRDASCQMQGALVSKSNPCNITRPLNSHLSRSLYIFLCIFAYCFRMRVL